MNIKFECSVLMKRVSGLCVRAVSYTHLDVYKRQFMHTLTSRYEKKTYHCQHWHISPVAQLFLKGKQRQILFSFFRHKRSPNLLNFETAISPGQLFCTPLFYIINTLTTK